MDTYVIIVMADIIPRLRHFFLAAQFMGLSSSFLPSQSTFFNDISFSDPDTILAGEIIAEEAVFPRISLLLSGEAVIGLISQRSVILSGQSS
jgi:hypothetical protein